MKLDLARTPFSTYGSFYTIRSMDESHDEPAGLYVCTVRKLGYRSRIAKIDLLAGEDLAPFAASADATLLRMAGEGMAGELCYADPSTISLRAEGAGFRLSFVKPSQLLDRAGRVEINCSAQFEIAGLTAPSGSLRRNTEWDGDNAVYGTVDVLPDRATGVAEAVLELVNGTSTWEPAAGHPGHTATRACAEQAYAAWRAGAGQAADPVYRDVYDLAAYLHWSGVVKPEGKLTRDTVYASKSGMAGIWSWDHCFHAMALCEADLPLAWAQFMLMFDQQDRYGALPDCMTDTYLHWGSTKPPIHGFALGWMMDKAGDRLTDKMLGEAYGPLSAWTEFWMQRRDANGNGLPEYHNGNDCGWDNSTIFQPGVPIESPDLASYLVLQMETLSRVAARLGKLAESAGWTLRASALLSRLLERFASQGTLRAIWLERGTPVKSDSLLSFVPLVLGRRLPEAIRSRMVGELRHERFWTKYGFASEALDSPLYEEDGYWRGPVWAPPAFLLVYALRELGEDGFAREAAARFLDTVAEGGMAENFSSRTGKPQRDPAIVWTASAVMLLQQYL